MEKALTVGGSNVTAVGNLQNVQKVRNMLHVLQSNVVKRLAIAFREWNNYLILKKIIEKEKTLQTTRKLESFIFSICQDVRDLLESDRCSLWLMDVDSQKLWAQHGDGLGTAMHVNISGNSHVADCARKKLSIIVKDAYKSSTFNASIDKQLGYRTTSILCVPLFDVNLNEMNPGYRSPSSKGGGNNRHSQTVRGVIQFVNKYSGEYSIEDRDNAEEFSEFLKMRILTADEQTDFRMVREEFKQWCQNKRISRYERRNFGHTIKNFQEHAEILLRCDKVEIFMPNLRDNKNKSLLRRIDGYGTGVEVNPKLCKFVLNILKEKRPEIVGDKPTIADLGLKKLFEQQVSSILIVPFVSKNQLGTGSIGNVAFAVKFGDNKFNASDREMLHKLGNLYGGLRENQSKDESEMKLRRRKIFKWMATQINRKKRDRRQSAVAVRSSLSSMKNTSSNKKSLSVGNKDRGELSVAFGDNTDYNTYMSIFRRTLAKVDDLATTDAADKASRNLPDIKAMMLEFFNLISGSRSVKRASITEHTMIASVNDLSKEIAIALSAANGTKERLDKAERMLKHEAARNSNLQTEIARIKKPIKKYDESTDTYDLGYKRKSLRILASVLKRILKKHQLRLWRNWLKNTGMLFNEAHSLHTKVTKILRVHQKLERGKLRRSFVFLKFQCAGQRRKTALSVFARGIKSRQTLYFRFNDWKVKFKSRLDGRNSMRRLVYRRKLGLQFDGWNRWKQFNKYADTVKTIIVRMKKGILANALGQMLRACNLLDKKERILRMITLKLLKENLSIGMAKWKQFLLKSRKKDHGRKMSNYMSRLNLRKQFLRWRTSVFFLTHSASHTDVAKGVAAMNVARLYTWRKKFMLKVSWHKWCDHRKKENSLAKGMNKILRLNKKKHFEIWCDKCRRRRRVNRLLDNSQRYIVTRMIKKWHIVTIVLQRRKTIVYNVFQRREQRLRRQAWDLWHENFSFFQKIDNKFLIGRNANLRRIFNMWHRDTADRRYANLKCSYTIQYLEKNKLQRIFGKWSYLARHESKKNKQMKKIVKIMQNVHLRVALRNLATRARAHRIFKQIRVRIVNKILTKCFYAMHEYTMHQKQCDSTIFRLCSRWAKNNLAVAWQTWNVESGRIKHYRKFIVSQTSASNRRLKSYMLKRWRKHTRIRIVIRKMELKSSIRKTNKVFDCWHWFADITKRRRLVAGRILRSMYKHVIHSSIKRWLDHAHHRTLILNSISKNLAKRKKLRMLHFYNTWADHAHKIAHERKILKNILFRITHRHQAGMFYTWHDHAHHRHLQRAKMKVVFNYMAKGYERKAWSIWTGRAAHYKKVYDLLFKLGQRWKYRNEYTCFHQWHIKIVRARQVQHIVKFGTKFIKRYLLRLALQKWEAYYRLTNRIRHKQWLDDIILQNQNQVISMQNRFQARKRLLRCYNMWSELVERRSKLRYIMQRCSFRSTWRTLYHAFSKWIFRLKMSDAIKRNLKLATRRKAIRTSIVAFRQWRSISWQMTTKLQKLKFAKTRKDIEKKIMKMPVAWSIMKWQMFASSMSYKELCRAEVRSIRTENRQLQNALLDYHRRGLFLLSKESKSKDLQKTSAPKDQYILQRRGNYSLSYNSGDDMLKATYQDA